MSHEPNFACVEREEQIVLLVCGELEEAAASDLDAHFSACEGCAVFFEEQKRLHEAFLLNAGPEPSPAFLAECRTELDAALDRASQPGFFGRLAAGFARGGWGFGYRNWLAAHPALGAAAFIFAGVLIGNLAPRWFHESTNVAGSPSSVQPAMIVNSSESTPALGVREIRLAPSGLPGGGMIVVQGVRETPVFLHGTADRPEIREALLQILPNGRDFDLDTRMMALDMLRPRSGSDTQVRDLLCTTAKGDGNPAVRLKALEALRGMQQDEAVRQTLTHALLNDTNAGVRIEAINSLKALAELQGAPVDRQMVDVLRERMEKDPSTYIRVQSAAAVRQLAQRGVY